ncbi:MAG: phosphate/phosphite/phosphonate ABC transporter substrate-binding protein [Chloroflexi bacterium]|nr:phosphate/phosphite/phosphonate ABC transporter substrate-binding protein [Chloroflexota bacterium]
MNTARAGLEPSRRSLSPAKAWHRVTGLAAAVAFLVVTASCALLDREPEIDLSARPQADQVPMSAEPARDRLVLAVAAVNSPMSTFELYADFARYLGKRLGMEAKFVSGKTYSEINSLLRSGDATLAIVCSGAYVYGREEFDLELLAAPSVRGQLVYYSYLIVHKDSPIAAWPQLKGRTFAFTDPLSNSGRIVPLYQIRQMGETPESLFSRYIFTYSHDYSIEAVAGKLVDAASVDSLVYDFNVRQGSDEAAKTKVIWSSPPFAINPVVVNPNLDARLKARLRTLLLEMHDDPEGRLILDRLTIDRFTPIEDGAYDSIRYMMQAVGMQRGTP